MRPQHENPGGEGERGKAPATTSVRWAVWCERSGWARWVAGPGKVAMQSGEVFKAPERGIDLRQIAAIRWLVRTVGVEPGNSAPPRGLQGVRRRSWGQAETLQVGEQIVAWVHGQSVKKCDAIHRKGRIERIITPYLHRDHAPGVGFSDTGDPKGSRAP